MSVVSSVDDTADIIFGSMHTYFESMGLVSLDIQDDRALEALARYIAIGVNDIVEDAEWEVAELLQKNTGLIDASECIPQLRRDLLDYQMAATAEADEVDRRGIQIRELRQRIAQLENQRS